MTRESRREGVSTAPGSEVQPGMRGQKPARASRDRGEAERPLNRRRCEARARWQGSAVRPACKTPAAATTIRQRNRDWLRSLAKVPVPLSRSKAENIRAWPNRPAQVLFVTRQIRGHPFHLVGCRPARSSCITFNSIIRSV